VIEVAELLPHLVDAVHGAHAAAPLAAQVGGAGGVLALPADVERVEHHEAGPHAHGVDVVRARDERRDLRPRRTGGPPRRWRGSVTPAEPLQVAHPVSSPSTSSARRPARRDVVELGRVHLARSSTVHWIHACAMTSIGVGS
jgi:hypothetical protein